MRAEDDEEHGHGVRVYACPLDGCDGILGVVPEPADYLEDAVSASQDAEYAIGKKIDQLRPKGKRR